MENNQNTNPTPNRPKRMQLGPRDMLIVALAVLVLTRINWTQLNSFHILILFLLFLMLMLRWANMRKEAVRKQAMERYKDQYETEVTPTPNSVFRWADVPAESPAEEVSETDMTAETPEPAEEKPEV